MIIAQEEIPRMGLDCIGGGGVSRERISDMRTGAYRVEDDVGGVLVGKVDHECEQSEENPYCNGFDEDPQDRL